MAQIYEKRHPIHTPLPRTLPTPPPPSHEATFALVFKPLVYFSSVRTQWVAWGEGENYPMKFHVINCSTSPPSPLPPPQTFIFLSDEQKFITLWSLSGVKVAVAELGEGPGELGSPLIFRPNWGPRGRKKFGRLPLPPPSQGRDDRPSPTSLKACIRLWAIKQNLVKEL